MAELRKVASWSGNTRGSVVFVHGLGGHPYETWRGKKEFFWPGELAKELPGLAVFSLEYDAAASNWLGTSMPILARAVNALDRLLLAPELKSGPVIFICHSLGGLVVKQIIRNANEKRKTPKVVDFLDRIKLVVFFGTPHAGASHATLLTRLALLTWPSDVAKDLVAYHPGLLDLNSGYRMICDQRKADLKNLDFFESTETPAGKIVKPIDPGLPDCEPIPIDGDHLDICKVRKADDQAYLRIKEEVEIVAPAFLDAKGTPLDTGTLTLHDPTLDDRPPSWKRLLLKAVRLFLLLVGVALLLFALGSFASKIPWPSFFSDSATTTTSAVPSGIKSPEVRELKIHTIRAFDPEYRNGKYGSYNLTRLSSLPGDRIEVRNVEEFLLPLGFVISGFGEEADGLLKLEYWVAAIKDAPGGGVAWTSKKRLIERRDDWKRLEVAKELGPSAVQHALSLATTEKDLPILLLNECAELADFKDWTGKLEITVVDRSNKAESRRVALKEIDLKKFPPLVAEKSPLPDTCTL